jgi:hypothetical protein
MVSRADGTLVLTVRVTLKPGRDDDLIALVLQARPRGMATVVREAMRSGVTSRSEDDEDDAFELPDIGLDL